MRHHGRALRRRYGRAVRMLQTAYGTWVEGRQIRSESGTTLGTFRDHHDAVRAWEILAEIEGRWGDSADTFDNAAWRGVRTLWAGQGLT